MKILKKQTPTEKLKERINFLNEAIITLTTDVKVLRAENNLYKEFFNLHFKQGIPSLIKALRIAIKAVSPK
jgi:hypothetical protein